MSKIINSKTSLFNDNETHGHVHDHTGITSCNDRHCHIHPGVTSPPIAAGQSHYHQIVGATTYQDGHYHTYSARTETAVALPNGSHTHHFLFRTSFEDGHTHNISGWVMAVKPEESYQGGSDWEENDPNWDDEQWPFGADKNKEKNKNS